MHFYPHMLKDLGSTVYRIFTSCTPIERLALIFCVFFLYLKNSVRQRNCVYALGNLRRTQELTILNCIKVLKISRKIGIKQLIIQLPLWRQIQSLNFKLNRAAAAIADLPRYNSSSKQKLPHPKKAVSF